jgi:hypothetical protein
MGRFTVGEFSGPVKRRRGAGGGPGMAALLLLALLLASGLPAAEAQVFFASRPDPAFRLGPVFVRAMVTPALADPEVDLLFSVVVPPTRSAAEFEQDLFLLWPGAVGAAARTGESDPALARFVQQQGFEVIDGGRLELLALNLYQVTAEGPVGRTETRVPGGAPFVTFVGTGGALGLSPPATWIRLPWTPELVNRTWLMDLRFTARGLLKPKPATWLERTFWGPRYRLVLSFHDVRHRAVFPLYFRYRDRVVRLSEDASQLMANFAGADTLKVDELFPPSARRQLSESLDNTEVISLFLDAGEGLSPQVLSVQFGYFSGVQSWAPVLIPALFFLLGNMASPVIRMLTERLLRRLAGRVQLGGARHQRPREHGVVVGREILARLIPGETTYEQVLRLCGPRPEEHEQLARPEMKTLVYRGRRAVPRRRRTLGWLATVDGWDVEDHEVEIVLERGVVADVQARVRRTHPSHPERV